MLDPNTPRTITLIGGGGFIGRHAVEALLKHNVRLRIAERNPKSAHTLMPLSKPGQIALVPADLTRPATIERAVEGADAVVNLVGTFDVAQQRALHVEGAGRAAELAKEAGAKRAVLLPVSPDTVTVLPSTRLPRVCSVTVIRFTASWEGVSCPIELLRKLATKSGA